MKSLKIPLDTIADVRAEIQYLSNVKINSFMGFRSKKQIKVNITLNTGLIYIITYKFKASQGRSLYNEFHHYLRKRERVYI